MAGEILRYTRTFVRSPRKNQRIRLTATASPTAGAVFNLTSRLGEYGRLRVSGKDLFFAYSTVGTPPFEFEAQITARGDVTEGQFLWASDGKIVLLYAASDGISSGYSTDAGKTFAGGGFTPGSHCALAAAADGTMAFAYYNLGGMIVALQPPGDPDFPLLLPIGNTVVDSGLLPLSFENDSFRICADARGWWWAHWRILGAGATSIWYSTDIQATPGVMTWAPTSGAVSGIASGTHPGICPTADGGLLAWAYVAGKLKVMHRGPGDVDWSTPAVLKDDAAADLAVGDAASSFAHAAEGPSRLLLTTNAAGEALVSDWWSSSVGETVKRF
jgi:hypothetical protein